MNNAVEFLALFYEIDQSTYLVIALFCAAAAYFVRPRIQNAAFLVFLYPLFCLVAIVAYIGAMHLHLFSPKKHAEWIMYTIFAAALGASVGIALVALVRKIQDKLVVMAHVRRTLKRDAEQQAKGYPISNV